MLRFDLQPPLQSLVGLTPMLTMPLRLGQAVKHTRLPRLEGRRLATQPQSIPIPQAYAHQAMIGPVETAARVRGIGLLVDGPEMRQCTGPVVDLKTAQSTPKACIQMLAGSGGAHGIRLGVVGIAAAFSVS